MRDWQDDVLDIVRAEGANRRTNARGRLRHQRHRPLPHARLVRPHRGVLVAPEVAIAGGTTAPAQKVLEAIFGDRAVRDMAKKARSLLLDRVEALYASERDRYTEVTGDLAVSEAQIRRLQQATAAIGEVVR